MRLQQSNDIIILLRSDALEEDLQLLEKRIWHVIDEVIFRNILMKLTSVECSQIGEQSLVDMAPVPPATPSVAPICLFFDDRLLAYNSAAVVKRSTGFLLRP
jgi:hypothetical protein